MYKKMLPLLALCLLAAPPAMGANEKIEPDKYICAELTVSNIDGVPPIFEGLQLDGYAAAKTGEPVADPQILSPLLIAVSDSCSAEPAEKALDHWQKARKTYPVPSDGPWRADKTTCGDYVKNPDDGSGFVIWLDAYNRGKTGTTASILADQATFDKFLEACEKSPDKLMIDVLAAQAK